MKKIACNLLILLLLIALVFTLGACQGQEKPKEDETQEEPMPQAFDDSVRQGYYLTIDDRLEFLRPEFTGLVAEEDFEEWINTYSSSTSDYTGIQESASLYSFIRHYLIPVDVARELLVAERNFAVDNKYNLPYFHDEEIDLILSKDLIEVARYFASPEAIRKGHNLYSVKWVYEHPIADYQAAGISPGDIETMLEYYSDFQYRDEAKLAFEAKLSKYLGREVKLERGASYWITARGVTYSAEWLATHNIQDYEEAGITTLMLADLLKKMENYEYAYDYYWVKSSYIRMVENGK